MKCGNILKNNNNIIAKKVLNVRCSKFTLVKFSNNVNKSSPYFSSSLKEESNGMDIAINVPSKATIHKEISFRGIFPKELEQT